MCFAQKLEASVLNFAEPLKTKISGEKLQALRVKPSENVELLRWSRFEVKQQCLTLLPQQKPKAKQQKQLLNPTSPQAVAGKR